MTEIKSFDIGSRVFFKDLPGYVEKDRDELKIFDKFVPGENSFNFKSGKSDVFLYRNMDKWGFMADAIESGLPMRVGKFLVPEFASYLHLEIDDLLRLHTLIEKLDEKHSYERIIYEAYLKNGGWFLTDEQRTKAYDEYKRTRQ